MTGVALTPVFAANLASDVYGLKDIDGPRAFNLKYKDAFNLDSSSMVKGKTGGIIVNKKHVMAFFGVGKGKYKGQAFVAIKGTASLYDALTDLNAGVHSSHTGFKVHQGFYYAFDSILTELRQFISSLKGVSVVHCVGHSLGGAVATLAADWIKANSAISSVRLYTFGSPRVGLENFAAKCASRLVAMNIHRLYHRTDPVPMVPTWPFFHVPMEEGYLVNSPVAVVPWEYHKMKHYIRSAEKVGDWTGFAKYRPVNYMDSAIEHWLKSDGVVTFVASTLEILDAAFIYVIKKILNISGIAIVLGGGATFTLLDRMAMYMAKGAKASTDLSIWVYHLVKKMAALIGIKVKEGMDFTVTFIRHVFMSLHRKISAMVWRIGQEVG